MPSQLTIALNALKHERYTDAPELLLAAAEFLGPEFPGMEDWFTFVRRRWLQSRRGVSRPTVVVTSWHLGQQAAGRAMALAESYVPFSDVSIVGSVIPEYGNDVWPPLKDFAIPYDFFTATADADFVLDAFRLVVRYPCDIVHLSKPRIHNVIFGWLFQLVWGARVIMDVDDEELSFVSADTPLDLTTYVKDHGRLPTMRDLHGETWTRLSVGMVKQFDGVTVSNVALQRRYGGQVIPHVRPASRFQPSPQKQADSRAEFGIPAHKTVFLFYGTPRAHKGVVEAAQALAHFQRDDVCYVIAGERPDAAMQAELDSIAGLDIRYVGSQPYERTADIVALADACVLLQDANSPVAQFQLPAKLMDALGMGLTVFAQVTPPLEDLAAKGAFIPVTQESLVKEIGLWLQSGSSQQAEQGRAVFLRELTVEAVSPVIQGILQDTSPRKALGLSWEGQLERLLNSQLPLVISACSQNP